MTTIGLVGGELVDMDGRRFGDVVVDCEAGMILDVGTTLDQLPIDELIDVSGCIVAPGLVDLHAHLRQPGGEAAETIASGCAAAAFGGYTAIVAMPDTDPCADSAAMISDLLALGKNELCEVIPSGALSVGQHGQILAPIAEMVELGVRLFTDNNPGVQDARFMRRALEYLGSIDVADGRPLLLGQESEVGSLAEGGVMNEGRYSTRLGLCGKPAEAEEIQVMRDIALARLTGVPIHFQKLSTAGSVALVRAAKHEGIAVTAGVCPHHFTLTDCSCSTFDPRFKVDPPLRTPDDIDAVKAALLDGSVDAIVSDHAPCTQDAKELPFDEASPGSTGLETALAVSLTELDLPIEAILGLMSWGPAKLAGVFPRHGGPIAPGAAANLCVIDPEFLWSVSTENSASRANNSIFSGKELKGKVRHTIYKGNPTVKDSALLQGARR